MTDEKENFDEDGAEEFIDLYDEFYDCVNTIFLEEESLVDIRGNGENIDEYWSKGWLSGFIQFKRYNYDAYEDRYYKVFPTRFRLKDFILTKAFRRVLKKNSDLRSTVRPLRVTEAKSNLYDDYYARRHNYSERRKLAEAYDYIKHYPSSLKELCIFKENKLVACSIFEVGNEAMFSNIAFWDLDEANRSLGILTVLLEMQYGHELNLDFYYLGHYFKSNPNYQYKTRFPGLELYDWDNELWIDYKNEAVIENLLAQKLPRRDHKNPSP